MVQTETPRTGRKTGRATRRPTEMSYWLISRTARRLKAQDVEVEFADEAVGLLAEEGFDPEYVARLLRRAIQRRVDNELSRMILGGSLEPGDRVVVGAQDGELTFEVVEGAAAVASEAR